MSLNVCVPIRGGDGGCGWCILNHEGKGSFLGMCRPSLQLQGLKLGARRILERMTFLLEPACQPHMETGHSG